MKNHKKGQAAMEFLMTYGWAILVVLAAIGALAYFGILNPGNWLPTKCTIGGGFSCLEHKVSNTGASGETMLYFKLQQNLGVDASSANLTINSTDCPNLPAMPIVLANLQNGDENAITVTCATTPLGANKRVRAKLSIVYTKATETQSHEATGDISSKVEG